jgi:MOSC domain-containing protein YiiM
MEVLAVHASAQHAFCKRPALEVELVEGYGVRGDAHYGQTVQHRSRVARDPGQPNLRQVHLLHEELLNELAGKGFAVAPGQMGENITTRGVDLLGLAAGTRLRLGTEALVEITGLRNPCVQIERFRPGLLAAVLDRLPDGTQLRKTGVMGIVLATGVVKAGDRIEIAGVPCEYRPLEPV